jgi:hypothetical protein
MIILLRYGILDTITVYNTNTIRFKYRYVINTGMLFQYVIDTGMFFFRNNIPSFNSNDMVLRLRLQLQILYGMYYYNNLVRLRLSL